MKKIFILAALPLFLAACASDNNSYNNNYTYGEMGEESLSGGVSDSYLLAAAPKFFIGDPYKIEGVQYIPAEDMTYNNTGIAGIIPTDMNGVTTSNGEVFNSDQLVATSKTLPLPTIVKVTNLENGREAILRVNNRGPRVNSRIMDVSQAAARQLGMTGTTKVQVRVLAEQSLQVKNATLGASTATAAPAAAPVYEDYTTASGGNGPYTVQVGAFYSEDNANMLAQRISQMGNVKVTKNDAGMFRVQILGLEAPAARRIIDDLRRTEGMAPGLLKNGQWVNADSI